MDFSVCYLGARLFISKSIKRVISSTFQCISSHFGHIFAKKRAILSKVETKVPFIVLFSGIKRQIKSKNLPNKIFNGLLWRLISRENMNQNFCFHNVPKTTLSIIFKWLI